MRIDGNCRVTIIYGLPLTSCIKIGLSRQQVKGDACPTERELVNNLAI